MPTLIPCQVNLGSVATVAKVEQLLIDHPADETPRFVELDLSSCRLLPPGAGWRLGNAMSRWASAGRVSVTVGDPGDFSGAWFLTITRSGLGMALALFATEIKLADGTDITAQVREYYEGPGRAASNNFVAEFDLPDTTLVESIDAFHEHLRQMAEIVGLDYEGLADKPQAALRETCFEAIENVLDHAFRSPYEIHIDDTLSYLGLGIHKKVDVNRALGEEFARYVDKLPGRLPVDREHLGFVEVVVVDSGVGMAARQSQNADIYTGDFDAEVGALRTALTAGGTIKLKVGDSFLRGEPGFGFTYIAEGLGSLLAFAVLRTGRSLMTLDATDEDKSWRLSEQPLGYVPGTAFHLVFPRISDQLQFVPE